ncbi:acetyl-CoA carboxylase biotin carboxyl carrier protein, partial [Sphingobium lactosutens]
PPGTLVKSPIVGTAYLSAEPGAAPFARVGSQVQAGDTVLIVEAMKVMNAIAAPVSGTVKTVLVDNGQPVEYDQPLIVIE